MPVLETIALDGWGNTVNIGYDLVSQQNNSTTYNRYISLHVVPGRGSVSWSNPSGTFYNPDATGGFNYSYGPGDHLLFAQQVTAQHDASGNHTETISGRIDTGILKRDFSYQVPFPKTKSAAVINSFTGSRVTSGFTATYTGDPSFTYKLRISIPHVVMLQTFDNYVSGTEVKLSYAAVQLAKQNSSGKNVPIGGVIETWEGNTKIGESAEPTISCTMGGSAKIRINGVWKDAIPYVRVNGTWKEAIPYIRINNQWKEGI